MRVFVSFFFFNDPATTEIYTLPLHDALPISSRFTTATRAPAVSGRLTGFCAATAMPPSRLNAAAAVAPAVVLALGIRATPVAGKAHDPLAGRGQPPPPRFGYITGAYESLPRKNPLPPHRPI